jgi:hypothetical protein
VVCALILSVRLLRFVIVVLVNTSEIGLTQVLRPGMMLIYCD